MIVAGAKHGMKDRWGRTAAGLAKWMGMRDVQSYLDRVEAEAKRVERESGVQETGI